MVWDDVMGLLSVEKGITFGKNILKIPADVIDNLISTKHWRKGTRRPQKEQSSGAREQNICTK